MRLVAVFCLALAFSTEPSAQSTPKPNHEQHLQALDWLTRGTWTAEFTTPEGKPFLIQNEIRWADTGTAIYFLTRFNHEPHYFGIYIYDPAAKQIKFFYTANNGNFTAGRTEPTATELKQDFQISTPEGVMNYTSLLKRDGEDAYDFIVYEQGSARPALNLHYVRK